MTLFTARPPLEAYGLASTVSEFCDRKNGLTDARATIVASLSRAENHDIARIACQTSPGAPRPPVRTASVRPAALTGPGPDATFLPTLRPLSRPGRAPRAVRIPEGGGYPGGGYPDGCIGKLRSSAPPRAARAEQSSSQDPGRRRAGGVGRD